MANSAVELIQGPQGPGGPSQSARLQFNFSGDNFVTPNNSDWANSVSAEIRNDPTNSALIIAAFADGTDEGVGGEIYVPAGASNIWLNFEYRAQTSQTGDQTADVQFHFRKIGNDAAPSAWTTVNMTELSIPGADLNWHEDVRSFLLSVIGMDDDSYYQWELTRYNLGTDTLVDDLYLHTLRIEVDFQSIRWLPSDTLRAITGTNWAINNNAAFAQDSSNPALAIRLFSDSTEQGVGYGWFVPTGIGKKKLRTISRANTTPASHAVDSFTSPSTITIEAGEGDVSLEYPAGRLLVISGSTGGLNDGVYEVASAPSATPTVITVVETSITTEVSPSPATSTPYKLVDMTLQYRQITDDGAVSAWADYDLPDPITIPANDYWQYDEWEIDLASLTTPIVTGAQYQFELTRNTGGTNDDLIDELALLAIAVEFY